MKVITKSELRSPRPKLQLCSLVARGFGGFGVRRRQSSWPDGVFCDFLFNLLLSNTIKPSVNGRQTVEEGVNKSP